MNATRIPPSIPPSITSLRTYGVSKTQLHSVAVNIFSIPESHRDCFASYYLRYWSGSYLADQICDGNLADGEHNYLVIYQHCTPYQVRRAPQVRLSFRAAMPEFDIPPYVIVRLA